MPYIAYLTDPEQHTNSAVTYPGKGETKDEARGNACYYNNQWPWMRVVAASKAPRWRKGRLMTTAGTICGAGRALRT